MNKLNAEEQLQQQLSQLPKSLQPSRDLWAGIDNALEQQQSTQHSVYQRLSIVAAGVGVLGLTVWLTLNVNVSPSLSAEDGSLNYVAVISDDFASKKQALLVKYEGQPSASDNWRVQLQELDDAATAIKKVLDQDPTNAQLIKMLQHTYQQQLALIIAVNKSPWQQI
ncbi:MAG: hypothetical protein ACI9FJ_001407 [Alteromonadaceae bacterium]|jgi:hypothetical protein